MIVCKRQFESFIFLKKKKKKKIEEKVKKDSKSILSNFTHEVTSQKHKSKESSNSIAKQVEGQTVALRAQFVNEKREKEEINEIDYERISNDIDSLKRSVELIKKERQ